MTVDFTRNLTIEYDEVVDWNKRLAREGPFYRAVFDTTGVRRVLDVACGTGHHAQMFHSWGLHVEGADISSPMIERCREQYPETDTLRWVVRSFDQPCAEPGSFDAALCLGNSLALAPNEHAVQRALSMMLQALRPGGVCVIQVLNLWRLPEGPTHWQKCLRLDREGRDTIILKGVHRVGTRGFVDFVELNCSAAELEKRADTFSFMGIEPAHLQSAVRHAGGEAIALHGDFQRSPYDRDQSQDLLVVARRAP